MHQIFWNVASRVKSQN